MRPDDAGFDDPSPRRQKQTPSNHPVGLGAGEIEARLRPAALGGRPNDSFSVDEPRLELADLPRGHARRESAVGRRGTPPFEAG